MFMTLFVCVGHLKRFMRGLGELVEVLKSRSPTPSSASLHTPFHSKFNNGAPPLSAYGVPSEVPGRDLGRNRYHSSSVDMPGVPTDKIIVDENQPSKMAAEKPRANEQLFVPQNHQAGKDGNRMGKTTFSKMQSLVALKLAGGDVDMPDEDLNSPPRNSVPSRDLPIRDAPVMRHSYTGPSKNLAKENGPLRSSVTIPTGVHYQQQGE